MVEEAARGEGNKLVVGFAQGKEGRPVEARNRRDQDALRDAWNRIRDWVEEVDRSYSRIFID